MFMVHPYVVYVSSTYLVAGLVKLLLLPFACGVPMVIQTRFDPVQFCANIERYRITISLIVPPVLVVLARHPGKCINQERDAED